MTSCDKLRGGAHNRQSADVRMGQPTYGNAYVSYPESIGIEKETRGTETSKYPEEEKETSIPSVAASERGRAQTTVYCGVEDHSEGKAWIAEALWNEPPKEVRVL